MFLFRLHTHGFHGPTCSKSFTILQHCIFGGDHDQEEESSSGSIVVARFDDITTADMSPGGGMAFAFPGWPQSCVSYMRRDLVINHGKDTEDMHTRTAGLCYEEGGGYKKDQ